MKQSLDSWQSGNPYERYMGRWSKLVAQEFLGWLAVSDAQQWLGQRWLGQRWLDVGCGTGALSRSILHAKEPQEILAIDSSPEFIAFAQQTNEDPRLRFQIASADSLPAESNTFDAVVSGLVLNFVPRPKAVLAEMMRVTKPGGVVAVYIWDYAEGMQMLRYFWDAAIELDANAMELDEGLRFPLCHETELKQLFLDSGLQDVTVRSIEVATIFPDFEDYWQPFLGGIGPAPGYALNLTATQQTALQQRLQSSLPQSEDGTISLLARAWAAQGIV